MVARTAVPMAVPTVVPRRPGGGRWRGRRRRRWRGRWCRQRGRTCVTPLAARAAAPGIPRAPPPCARLVGDRADDVRLGRLGPHPPADPRRTAPAVVRRPVRRRGGRRAGLPSRAAHAVPAGGQGRHDPRRPGFTARRRGRRGHDRPGQRRRPGPALRRRGHAGAAGPAPHLAADHRLLPGRWRPSSATRCRSTPTSPRRSRAASATTTTCTTCSCCRSRARSAGHPRARPPRRRCATSPGPTVAATWRRPPAPSPSSTRCCVPGDCLYLPRGYLHAATALGGVSTHLTHRRPHLDPARPGRAAARRRARPPRRGRGGAGVAPARAPTSRTPPGSPSTSRSCAPACCARCRRPAVSEVAGRMATRHRTSQRAAPVGPLAQLRTATDPGDAALTLRPHLAARLETQADGSGVLRSRAGDLRLRGRGGRRRRGRARGPPDDAPPSSAATWPAGCSSPAWSSPGEPGRTAVLRRCPRAR